MSYVHIGYSDREKEKEIENLKNVQKKQKKMEKMENEKKNKHTNKIKCVGKKEETKFGELLEALNIKILECDV